MNLKEEIINHAKTDPNAYKHMELGSFGSFILAIILFIGTILISPNLMICVFISLCFGGFLTGIAIELVQRVQRIGKTQNTLKESFLDIMVTGFWFPLMILIY